MRKGVENRIIMAIRSKGRGWVFSYQDIKHLGSRGAVDISLHRLERSGKIRRILSGLYDYPGRGTLIKEMLSPDMDSVAAAIARRYGWQIRPTESAMLNILGLSTQVPGRIVYDSDGPNRTFQIGNSSIEFRKTKRSARYKLPNKDIYLQRQYGINLKMYNQMLTNQEECCGICKCHRNELRTDLHVDHDHETGKVRGLLCRDCNTGLGFFKDSLIGLEMAIQYLTKSHTSLPQ